MNAIVIEHVPVAELPSAWQAKLAQSPNARVTVRIEEEPQSDVPAEEFLTNDPAFGIWRDRQDMPDVAAYVRKLREPRYSRDGSRGHGRP
jgi:hypothetical protein